MTQAVRDRAKKEAQLLQRLRVEQLRDDERNERVNTLLAAPMDSAAMSASEEAELLKELNALSQ